MKEKIKENWLIIFLITIIIFLIMGGFFLCREQNQIDEVSIKRIQILQEYIQEYTIHGEPPFFEIRELKNDVFIPTGITTKYLTKSYNSKNSEGIIFEFNEDGKELFAELTKRNIGNSVALFLEGINISAPEVTSERTDGTIMITGNFTKEETENLIERIRYEIEKNSF